MLSRRSLTFRWTSREKRLFHERRPVATTKARDGQTSFNYRDWHYLLLRDPRVRSRWANSLYED